jgi:hypothetical protein
MAEQKLVRTCPESECVYFMEPPHPDCSCHRVDTALNPADPQELEDFLDEAINDSIDMDWTSRVAAQAVIREMEREGLCLVRASKARGETE